MGWSIGYDSTWDRDIGYGVPAYCDHPDCSEKIDRGLAYVCCGQEPYGGDEGCGLFFCEKHHSGALGQCERCVSGQDPFEPKPEHPVWIRHVLADDSWAAWRAENAARCDVLRAMLPAA